MRKALEEQAGARVNERQTDVPTPAHEGPTLHHTLSSDGTDLKNLGLRQSRLHTDLRRQSFTLVDGTAPIATPTAEALRPRFLPWIVSRVPPSNGPLAGQIYGQNGAGRGEEERRGEGMGVVAESGGQTTTSSCLTPSDLTRSPSHNNPGHRGLGHWELRGRQSSLGLQEFSHQTQWCPWSSRPQHCEQSALPFPQLYTSTVGQREGKRQREFFLVLILSLQLFGCMYVCVCKCYNVTCYNYITIYELIT
ncbi:hypothetical protein JZ751_010085 [Albula glossodonta]|uniref:Uncharacterized protein n=1 Tax=Albula glossodonta TaxID=121402 RepID=A0A8T2N1P7_9TELE|nr:hypothetical protein JZ751_010085 [Albula glossodonta]